MADWDKLVDYTCIMQCVRKQAAQTLQHVDPGTLASVMDQIQDAFMARPGVAFSFFVEPHLLVRKKIRNYFISSYPHHDIHTFCYWQIFWHSI